MVKPKRSSNGHLPKARTSRNPKGQRAAARRIAKGIGHVIKRTRRN